MAEKKKLSADLKPASFRKVPFFVDASDIGIGRRTQVNEYPQKDKPYVDDIGRAARELTVTAFVVGEDYVDQAKDVIGAFEEPGSGKLVHPWFGEVKVTLRDIARVSFNRELGVARIMATFVESGELAFPSSEVSSQAASRKAASKLEKAATQSFAEKFGVKGFQDFVAAAASGNLGKMLGIAGLSEVGKMLGFANSLAKTISTAIALISNPKTLGFKILGAFGLSGLSTTVAAWSNIVRQLSRLGKSPKMSASVVSGSTSSRARMNANAVAVFALGRQVLLAQAVGASSLVGSTTDAGATPTVAYEDMIGTRDELVAALDQEALTADYDVYLALMEARAAVWRDLTERARDSARLSALTLPETLPAVVVAYDRYEDAGRADEIVSRNGIRHPGFISPAPIRVLTR